MGFLVDRPSRPQLFSFRPCPYHHFRGLAAFWEMPAGEKTANGKWTPAPQLNSSTHSVRVSPGSRLSPRTRLITPDVHEIIDRYASRNEGASLAFGDDPGKIRTRRIITSPTAWRIPAPTITTLSAVGSLMPRKEKERLFGTLDEPFRRKTVAWEFICMVRSIATWRLSFSMLNLGASPHEPPINTTGNWEWRLSPESLTPDVAAASAILRKPENSSKTGIKRMKANDCWAGGKA